MSASTARSRAAFERACRVLVGGVNSPVRAYRAVGGTPRFIASARGSRLTDVDGNEYVDYVGGYGPMILGHAPPAVVEAVARALAEGTCYGAPTPRETDLAERIVEACPAIEKVRFVSSGTEAVMSAVRLARGATGRRRIVKCIGCYHGHADAMLVAAGSGATTLGIPSSPGVPEAVVAQTSLVAYNDLDAAAAVFDDHPDGIAALLVEPVAANMGLVPPREGYLQGLRDLCDRFGALLIFDEVITGFRVAYGGAAGLYGVRPDIMVLGKIIGGGLPVGAYGGAARLMRHLAPEGPVYQAGTLSGNPAAMAAGIATLDELRRAGFYERLEATSGRVEAALRAAAGQADLAGATTLTRVGSLLCCFFTPGPVTDYASATASDTRAFAAYFQALLEGGVNIAPAQFEAMFVSSAHTADDVERTAAAARRAFAAAAAARAPQEP